MRRPGLVVFALAGAAATAATAQPGRHQPQPSFSPQRIEADVRFLADDLLEGRGTGTRGYDIAAAFVAQRFNALGLTPGNGTSWFQPIEFLSTELDPKRQSSITINGKRFANLDNVLISPGVTGEHEKGSAPVVFVGYGLEEARFGLDDYRGIDVRGKIVAMLAGAPGGLPSEAAAVLQREKTEVAARKGAVGVLQIGTPTSLAAFPWPAVVEGAGVPKMRFVHPDGRPNDPTASLTLSASLDPAATDALFAGTPMANGKLFAMLADRTVRPRGFALPARVSVERFSKIGRVRSANVIGLLPGSDPRLAREIVLLTGHLDHLGLKNTANADRIYNGAMDNASGIATMLEVARAFSQSSRRPRRSIAFVAVTGEEKGLLGSEFSANYLRPAGYRPIANVNLDMPILTYDFVDVIAYGAEHSTMGSTIDRAIRQMGIKLTPDPQPEQNLFVRSDHYNYVRKGIPSVFLKTGIGNGGTAADREFRSKHYHKVSDEVNSAFNWNAGAKFARINYLIASEIANAATVPLWYRGDYFGDIYAPNAPKAPKR